MILQDSAWFCKILQNSEAFCKIYDKFEAFIPKVFVKKLPKIEANFTNFEVWCSKTELPKIEITNIEGYQYRGIPVLTLGQGTWRNYMVLYTRMLVNSP